MGRASKQNGTKQSPNIQAYKHLLSLNRQSAAIVETLDALCAKGSIHAHDAKYCRLMIDEVRASASQCVLEGLDAREMQLAARASKQRLKLEKKLFGS